MSLKSRLARLETALVLAQPDSEAVYWEWHRRFRAWTKEQDVWRQLHGPEMRLLLLPPEAPDYEDVTVEVASWYVEYMITTGDELHVLPPPEARLWADFATAAEQIGSAQAFEAKVMAKMEERLCSRNVSPS